MGRYRDTRIQRASSFVELPMSNVSGSLIGTRPFEIAGWYGEFSTRSESSSRATNDSTMRRSWRSVSTQTASSLFGDLISTTSVKNDWGVHEVRGWGWPLERTRRRYRACRREFTLPSAPCRPKDARDIRSDLGEADWIFVFEHRRPEVS